MSLSGKTAVVTGAARGIGRAYAQRLAADGANVVALDIENPEEALTAATGQGEKVGLVCDLAQPDQILTAAATVVDRFDRCDILVNNAAIFPTGSLENLTLETWHNVQAVNVEAGLLLAKALAPRMRQAGWGRIVNTGSGNTLLQVHDLAYMTSKGAVHALTRALANELGEHGITVNAIAPGVVATEGFLRRDRTTGPPVEEMLDRLMSMQTIKRRSVPEDAANLLAFLVSDEAGFITGQILHVDGGVTRSGA